MEKGKKKLKMFITSSFVHKIEIKKNKEKSGGNLMKFKKMAGSYINIFFLFGILNIFQIWA